MMTDEDDFTNDYIFTRVHDRPETFDVHFISLEDGISKIHAAIVTASTPGKWAVQHLTTPNMVMAGSVPQTDVIAGDNAAEMQANFRRTFRVTLMPESAKAAVQYLTRTLEAQRQYFCGRGEDSPYYVSLCVAMGNFLGMNSDASMDKKALEKTLTLIADRMGEAREEREMRRMVKEMIEVAKREMHEQDGSIPPLQ